MQYILWSAEMRSKAPTKYRGFFLIFYQTYIIAATFIFIQEIFKIRFTDDFSHKTC